MNMMIACSHQLSLRYTNVARMSAARGEGLCGAPLLPLHYTSSQSKITLSATFLPRATL